MSDIGKKFEKTDKKLEKETEALEKELLFIYKGTFRRIEGEIGEIYRKVSNKESLTYTEIHKINRYEPLMRRISKEIDELSGEKIKIIDKGLSEIFKNSYVYSIEAIEDHIGKHLGISSLNTEIVKASLQNPISGLTLHERLEFHRVEIVSKIKENITQGLIIGESYGKLSKRLQEDLEFSAAKAKRVIRTESHRVISEARQKSYEDSISRGLEMKKQWLATSDGRTRDTHSKLNGKIIGVEEKFEIRGYKSDKPGGFGVAKEDINCRCRVIPYFED